MMRENIIEIKAKQKLTHIMVVDTMPEGINNAFNKLIRKLTIIADLFTPVTAPAWTLLLVT
jgi:Mg2+ and Co2+ transporter CorA